MLGDTLRVLEQAGVVIGGPVSGFHRQGHATLPAGWRKVARDSLWSDLVDNKGRKRAAIFHRTTFRDNFIDANCRFNIFVDYTAYEKGLLVYFIADEEKRIFSTKPIRFSETHPPYHKEVTEAAFHMATTWLKKYYPDWQDASAYWD